MHMEHKRSEDKKVAVILSGCGHFDGAEIRESVLSLLNLDKVKIKYEIYAPDKDQHHVIIHNKGEESQQKRNILEESSRIARGKISALTKLDSQAFDALVLPGGFGVAKNLCTFAFNGANAEVDDLIKNLIIDFHTQQKPIVSICIAPALVALCLGNKGVSLTIGNDIETANEITKTGAKHIECDPGGCVVDSKNKVISTPAYMYDDANLSVINSGIEKSIAELLKLI